MAFVATFVGGAALTGLGAAAGAVGATGAAAGLAGAAGSGLIAGTVGGALIGAGVGQLTGGNTKSTLTGMGIGAGAGALAGGMFGAGGMFAGGGTGATAGTASNFSWSGMAANGGAPSLAASTAGASGSAGAAGAGGSSLLASTLTNPLFLGTAGLGIASAFSGTGQSFQDKITLKAEGQKLMYGKGGSSAKPTGGYVKAVKNQYDSAARGDIPEKAFQDVSNAKTIEAGRQKMSQAQLNATMADLGNQGELDRGTVAQGGGLASASAQDAGQRTAGLFAPHTILNNYRREELFNAIGNIQNVQNLENQTASINYQGKLAKWNAENMNDAQKGAAIGNAFSLYGNMAMNQAYLNRVKAVG